MNPSDRTVAPRVRVTGNRFIDSLPAATVEAIARIADLRTYPEGTELARRGDLVGEVYFPTGGAIAHVEPGEGEATIEIAAIGRDGVSGFEALLGVAEAQFTRVTTLPLATFCVDAPALGRIYASSEPFRALLGRYAVASIRLASMRAACRDHHLVDRRLAGWILALYRLSNSPELRVTHALVAQLLGAERAGITRAYGRLAAAGAIRYERGRIRVRDEARLGAAACGCADAATAVSASVYA
ncbi:MAG TPA: Crp/Fnr family transcriptional regulator [Candidatus Elarobacter sp.]